MLPKIYFLEAMLIVTQDVSLFYYTNSKLVFEIGNIHFFMRQRKHHGFQSFLSFSLNAQPFLRVILIQPAPWHSMIMHIIKWIIQSLGLMFSYTW